MRHWDESFELQSLTGYVTSGVVTMDAAAPLKATCSAKVDMGGVNWFERALAYEYNDIFVGSWVMFDTTNDAGNTILEWWNDSASVGQLRLNAAGKIEAYVDGVLKGTSTKILEDSTLYRVELHIVYDLGRGRLQLRINDRAINQIEFLGDTLVGAYPNITKLRFGSLDGTGSGDAWFDDITVNDAINVTNGDYSFAGLETGILAPVTGVGAASEWDQFPASGTHDDKVDEIPDNGDTDYITTGTAMLRDTFTFDPVMAPPGTVLSAVKFEVVTKATNVPIGQKARSQLGFVGGPVSQNAKYTVQFSGATGGYWQFVWHFEVADLIAFDADAAAVLAKLEALRRIGPGNVTVTFSVDTFTIEFIGALANTRIANVSVGNALDPDPTAITLVNTQIGKGIWYGDGPPVTNTLDNSDILQDAVNEYNQAPGPLVGVGTAYEKRAARRRLNPSNSGTWNPTTANSYSLSILADPPPP